jgi:hypothetical protein
LISKETAHFTIGFAGLTASDATAAGSGSVVTVGSLHGILTAAHVIEALPRKGPVGIVTYQEKPARYEKPTITMEDTEHVVVRGTVASKGPDIGFLRIPPRDIGWIAAKNSFYNLSKRRDDVLARKAASRSHTDALTGLIHEMTKDAPTDKPGERRKSFTAIFCGATLVALRYFDDYDLLYYEPTAPVLPKSFEGASGGAIWRFYVEEKDGQVAVIDRLLYGVPFYQSLDEDVKKTITCHGPMSIYRALVDAIIAKWPKEATQ